MIRRDAAFADGSPCWVLISQVDHAHLAGELAEVWRDELPVREIVVPTIYRHDDGWRGWEQSPTIDPETGRPRSFLDMPSDEAHEIWRQSIDGVADLGPLAQYMVAEHFCRLRRGLEPTDDAKVHAFLSEFAERCDGWLTQWQQEDPARSTPAMASRAVDWLQFFDRFSLWLCMAERHEPHPLPLPDGRVLSLTPHSADSAVQQIDVAAWPWTVAAVELAVSGRAIPAVPLSSDAEFESALAVSRSFQRRWRFTPTGQE